MHASYSDMGPLGPALTCKCRSLALERCGARLGRVRPSLCVALQVLLVLLLAFVRTTLAKFAAARDLLKGEGKMGGREDVEDCWEGARADHFQSGLCLGPCLRAMIKGPGSCQPVILRAFAPRTPRSAPDEHLDSFLSQATSILTQIFWPSLPVTKPFVASRLNSRSNLRLVCMRLMPSLFSFMIAAQRILHGCSDYDSTFRLHEKMTACSMEMPLTGKASKE